MKKIFLSAAACLLVSGLLAQDKQGSIGLDVGLPMGDWGEVASLQIGPSLGIEIPVGDAMGFTVQAAYQIISLKDNEDSDASYTMIPFQAGLKYYFAEQQAGPYGHAQFGIHQVRASFFGVTVSDTDLSWAIGGGYQLEKFDIGVRYNSIMSEGGSSDYIGLRVAYILGM